MCFRLLIHIVIQNLTQIFNSLYNSLHALKENMSNFVIRPLTHILVKKMFYFNQTQIIDNIFRMRTTTYNWLDQWYDNIVKVYLTTIRVFFSIWSFIIFMNYCIQGLSNLYSFVLFNIGEDKDRISSLQVNQKQVSL